MFTLRQATSYVLGVEEIVFRGQGAGDRTGAVDPSARPPPGAGPRLLLRRQSGAVDRGWETFYIDLLFYHVRLLPAPMQEELPSVEDLQEVLNKLHSEMETLRKEVPDE